ncbi:NAD(P)/FAD-dependent oxidoreductase [Mycobacterium sp. GA-1199]|uniref:flavin-containing monooxygenase n=1 Tax=Mycobacterium sp. GA-1199 TaxID=1772287 RepID=UPI000B2DA97D|nr:NAD(P)/FAD-dependent oxidoreductase [Mycobacterium sp. GA-1199]
MQENSRTVPTLDGDTAGHAADSPDVDVLVIGAGITGLGFASRLKIETPEKSVLIVDAHKEVGGTWHLFRYPGIRSDSDLITYGYQYKPWTKEKAIAPGAEIKNYLIETVDEFDLADRLRLGARVESLDWSSAESLWTATLRDVATGEVDTVRARWVVSGTGYFDHAAGYRPTWEGEESFAGTLVHAQDWPEDLDYAGKRIVVIGSGATAVTLLPALAEKAGLVTMLQRSPSYIIPLPGKDVVLDVLRRFLPLNTAFEVTRKVNIQRLRTLVSLSRRYPRFVRAVIRQINKAFLPKGFDVDTHLNPAYNPWEQRMCIVPDGDLYGAIRRGRATIATDTIKRFVPDGIELTSGQFLPADIVVAATGLKLIPFGGVKVFVDGEPIDWPDTVLHKAVMVSGLPNFLMGFGYTNNSWTLRIDLASAYLARLFKHMDSRGYDTVVPRLADADAERELILEDLTSNYVRRSVGAFPRQVKDPTWSFPSHYRFDLERLAGPIDDGTLEFGRSADRAQLTVIGGVA